MAVTTNGDRPRYPSIAGWYTRSAEATELTYWDGKTWKVDGPETSGVAPGPSSADSHGRSHYSGATIALTVILVILGLLLASCVAMVGIVGGLMNQGL